MNRAPGAVVTEVLRAQVLGVPPPAAGLADRARDAARRRRHRQRLSVGAAALAVAAAVAVAPFLGGAGARSSAPLPADGRSQGVSLTVRGDVVSPVDLGTSRREAAPASAWFSWRELHRSDAAVVSIPDDAVGAVETPDGGALVTGGTVTHPTLRAVDADGTVGEPIQATPPVVGRDGQVAYVDFDRHVVVRIAADGTLAELFVPFPDNDIRLVGFAGDAVVADTPLGRPRLIHRDGTVEQMRGLAEATASDAPSGSVASRSPGGRCLELHRADRLLWRSCANSGRFSSIVAISPDAHHVLLRRGSSGNPGTSEYAVVDSVSGRVVRLFAPRGRSLGLGQATFERDDSVLVVAYRDATARIMRCHLDGLCAVTSGPAGAGDTAIGTKPFAPMWLP